MQTRTFSLVLLAVAGCGSGGTSTPDGVSADAGPPDATTGCTTTVAPRPGTVITATGAVGTHAGASYAYLGIPYAAPPPARCAGGRPWQRAPGRRSAPRHRYAPMSPAVR